MLLENIGLCILIHRTFLAFMTGVFGTSIVFVFGLPCHQSPNQISSSNIRSRYLIRTLMAW